MEQKTRRKILKNKPLVEAIFELRWDLLEQAPGIRIDPHYKILVGRVYDRVITEYHFHEPLPTSMMPDELGGYIVQHRFRKAQDQWPLIQIGPGIITLNDTETYVWEDFERKIAHLLETVFEVYPDAEKNLKVNRLLLRYIDAVAFNFMGDDIFKFLREKMKMEIRTHDELFKNTGIGNLPLSFNLNFAFPSNEPKGIISIRFSRGKTKGTDALVWETMVQSSGNDAPTAKEEIVKWVKAAHDLTDDWFFKIIEGELKKRFE